ncbi:hypothetical protein AJ80_04813 [Polytolypa hystricis UAMH7299]|uniref:Rhodopsin domain-containing protein n=1 Tax=Polytolypa hystricis (strain UAMH7299) TaxID=1447883 RepID=A0A2B7Y8T3_POLH7|nr:hypothetical protein AJ80_04813 [Polytolypa hystricis UAMH7299]
MLDNVENQQASAIALTWLFPTISTVIIVLRVFSRYIGRNFGWDDGLILVAWLLVLFESITTHGMIKTSYTGYHEWDIPEQTVEEKVTALKWSYALQLGYHPMMGAIRGSIVLFLFRVGDQRRHINWSLHVVFWLNVGYTISTTAANIFTCSPVSYMYRRPEMDKMVGGELVPGGTCFSSLHFILASCALSIFMDLIIIPIPTAMVWGLSMRRKTKIAVVAVMSMGWIATAVSVGRFVIYYYRWQPDRQDRSYDIGFVISVAESNVAMWAACAPALKRLFASLMPYWFSSAHMTEDYYTETSDRWSSNPTRQSGRFTKRSTASRTSQKGYTDGKYQMQDLCPDSDSQVHIIGNPQAMPMRSYSFRIGVGKDVHEEGEATYK